MVVHNFSNLKYRLKTEKHENRPTLLYYTVGIPLIQSDGNRFFVFDMAFSNEDRILNKIYKKHKFLELF